MFDSMSLLMFIFGIVIGFALASYIFKRKTPAGSQFPNDLNDVKALVQNLTNQI